MQLLSLKNSKTLSTVKYILQNNSVTLEDLSILRHHMVLLYCHCFPLKDIESEGKSRMVMLATEDPSVDGHLASTPRRRGSDDILLCFNLQMCWAFSYLTEVAMYCLVCLSLRPHSNSTLTSVQLASLANQHAAFSQLTTVLVACCNQLTSSKVSQLTPSYYRQPDPHNIPKLSVK